MLSNRIYQQLSNSVAGSQEFTAIAKLYELDQDGDYDLLVLDTPPSRNALDFLDAPGRLSGFFQGRAMQMFLRPAGIGGRILGRGTGVVFSIMERLTGVDLLHDLSVFFRALGGMVDGFTERARRVGLLLTDPGTTFLIVTAPRHDPVEEAIFFHRKLRDADMPFGGLVVNRLHRAVGNGALPDGLDADLAHRVEVAAHELAALAERDAANVEHLRVRARRPTDDRGAGARRRRPRRRGPRARARAPVRRWLTYTSCCPSSASSISSATRRSWGSRWPHRTSRRIARRLPPRSAIRSSTSGSGRTWPVIAARSSRIASSSRRWSAGRSSGVAQMTARRSVMPS